MELEVNEHDEAARGAKRRDRSQRQHGGDCFFNVRGVSRRRTSAYFEKRSRPISRSTSRPFERVGRSFSCGWDACAPFRSNNGCYANTATRERFRAREDVSLALYSKRRRYLSHTVTNSIQPLVTMH